MRYIRLQKGRPSPLTRNPASTQRWLPVGLTPSRPGRYRGRGFAPACRRICQSRTVSIAVSGWRWRPPCSQSPAPEQPWRRRPAGQILCRHGEPLVVGRLKQERWEDGAGTAHAKIVIVAEHFEFQPANRAGRARPPSWRRKQLPASGSPRGRNQRAAWPSLHMLATTCCVVDALAGRLPRRVRAGVPQPAQTGPGRSLCRSSPAAAVRATARPATGGHAERITACEHEGDALRRGGWRMAPRLRLRPFPQCCLAR